MLSDEPATVQRRVTLDPSPSSSGLLLRDELAKREQRADLERRVTYLSLTGVFAALLGAFSLFEGKKGKPAEFNPVDLAMLGLAGYRMGRLVAFDKVFETVRMPFTQTVPHDSGAGDTVEPKGNGARQAIGELISCPICAGTWVTALLVYGMGILPGPTRTLVKVMSAMGIAEFLNAASEALQWQGEKARQEVGARNRLSR